ncbi:putative 11.5 kDa [Guinea pig adenovirus 1]|uniref:11.5 kDa n=1 Tax=Guinea pig adenovirus 1 TaxID=2847100 RepID=A0AC61M074_9ADEN|nr:putative 11.5 kDa [Guinea pig adenovirus]QIZ64150.1 putative 11.5 kDa [Guinea pig adenovirus 1]QIZ64182.1 putative 11.5 kDa [Guinea pig adenovirus]
MTSAQKSSVSKKAALSTLSAPLARSAARRSSSWSAKTLRLLSSRVAKEPYRELDSSLAMLRRVALRSASARSLAAMFTLTYSRARQFQAGNTVVRSSGTTRTRQPRLQRVTASRLVHTSPRRRSLVQHSRPPRREQKGGSTSNRRSSGGSASITNMAGRRRLSK